MNELLKVEYTLETTGNVNHNHCVKADPKDPLPFCYTTDPNVRYEYCDCEDSSNPDSPFGFGGQQGWPQGQPQGFCRVTTTVKGIVNPIKILPF